MPPRSTSLQSAKSASAPPRSATSEARGISPPRAEHFAGPIVKAEIDHIGPGELEIETGYLFALGRARDDAKGQLRLNLEYAFHF